MNKVPFDWYRRGVKRKTLSDYETFLIWCILTRIAQTEQADRCHAEFVRLLHGKRPKAPTPFAAIRRLSHDFDERVRLVTNLLILAGCPGLVTQRAESIVVAAENEDVRKLDVSEIKWVGRKTFNLFRLLACDKEPSAPVDCHLLAYLKWLGLVSESYTIKGMTAADHAEVQKAYKLVASRFRHLSTRQLHLMFWLMSRGLLPRLTPGEVVKRLKDGWQPFLDEPLAVEKVAVYLPKGDRKLPPYPTAK